MPTPDLDLRDRVTRVESAIDSSNTRADDRHAAVVKMLEELKRDLDQHSTNDAQLHEKVIAKLEELKGALGTKADAEDSDEPEANAIQLSPSVVLEWARVLIPILAALGIGFGARGAVTLAPAAPVPAAPAEDVGE